MHSEPPSKIVYRLWLMAIFLLLTTGFLMAMSYAYPLTVDPKEVAIKNTLFPLCAAFFFILFLLVLTKPMVISAVRKMQLDINSYGDVKNPPIEDLVRSFELGRISKENWHHREHLRIALYYLFYQPTCEDAIIKMRCGLVRYGALRDPQIDCTQRYHETITVFWLLVLDRYIKEKNVETFAEIENLVCCSEFIDPEYLYQCYTEEDIRSTKFRAMYVPPTSNSWILESYPYNSN